MSKLALLGGEPIRTAPFPTWPTYGPEEEQQLREVLYKTQWGIGKRVGKIQEFEERFSRYHNASFGVACANCSLALEIMLAVAGVGVGDEVIVPSYTFVATASAVTRVGATPIFADIDLDTFALDPESVEALVSECTRAIIPVHFAGYFGHIECICQIAEEHNLIVIEDAAQAHGGQWDGKHAGRFGVAAGFSFQYSKNMTAGEGGIIITGNEDFYARCWEYIWHGRRKGGLWYEHFQATSNFRITEWQAAVLLAQLERLDGQNQTRHLNGQYLDQALKGIEGVRPTQVDGRMKPHPRHLYIVRFSPDVFEGIGKETLVEALKAEGIPALPGYGFPLYRNPAFVNHAYGWHGCDDNKQIDYTQVRNPNAEFACCQSFWLIHNTLLGTREDMDDIVRAIAKVSEERAALRDYERVKTA